jgi:hypothetical protein
VRERLGSAIAAPVDTCHVPVRLPVLASGRVDFFREYYGPTNRAFAALTGPNQEALHADLVALWSAQNQSGDTSRTVVDTDYLQVVAIRSKQ